MNANTDLREIFFNECEELLEVLSDGIAQMETGEASLDTVNAVFRAVHSIKGGAGAFGLDALVEFAHGFENTLDDMRAGKLETNPKIVELLYMASDRLADLVESARDRQEADPSESKSLLEQLAALSGTPPTTAAPAEAEVEFAPMSMDFSLDLPEIGGDDGGSDAPHEFRFTPTKELYSSGNDPALLFRALAELGELEVVAGIEDVPPFLEQPWDQAYLFWDIKLTSDKTRDDILEVFEFVDGLCKIEFNDPVPMAAASVDPIESLDPATEPAAVQTVPDTPPPAAKAEATKPKKPTEAASANTTIRVDLDRVDRLINLVGELVISEAMLTQSISEVTVPSGSKVETALATLKQLSSEIQERVMAIRAQPIKFLFQRMSRIVRESGQATGKQARLITEGEMTEVDKTVIERLADPLTHMIRNAMDHGLEKPEKRLELGKPEKGDIVLSAAHRSGRVVIELKDDGAGINRPKVKSLAISKGLIPADVEMSDTEIDNLLFLPGFSTADAVSNLSGRGVGMDVVRSEIQSLGGRVTISSTPGQGTAVTISLPLTLAVLEGMVVQVAGETLVVPTTALRETIRGRSATVHQMGSGDKVLAMRGELVPIVDLGARLGFRNTPQDLDKLVFLLVESDADKRTAIAVDRVVDQREVVIKGLEANYGRIDGVAAATILGDGRIALIVDTDQLAATGPSRNAAPMFT
ncbi:MAG: chemotaxis protein CheA [Paracoccaceae bacterium]